MDFHLFDLTATFYSLILMNVDKMGALGLFLGQDVFIHVWNLMVGVHKTGEKVDFSYLYWIQYNTMLGAKKVLKSALWMAFQSLLCSMLGVGGVRFRPPGKAEVNTSSKVPACNKIS